MQLQRCLWRCRSTGIVSLAWRALPGTADELGQLVRIFQSMARQVYAREQRLKQQVQGFRTAGPGRATLLQVCSQ